MTIFKKELVGKRANLWSAPLSGEVCEFCGLELTDSLSAKYHESDYCAKNPNSKRSKGELE